MTDMCNLSTRLAVASCLVAIAGSAASERALSDEHSAREQPAHDLPRHELVFARHADAARTDYDIWRMCGDGTQMASLVVQPGHQFQVTVSPDGEELVYTDLTDGRSDLWRRPFGRGEAVNLTDHPARDSGPAFAPDGARLAFFSTRDAEKPELYAMDLASGAIERLTDNAYHDSGAVWTPDGEAIVFTRYFPPPEGSEASGRGDLMRIDVASHAEERMTDLGGFSFDADYSPDGRTIAFHRTAEAGSEIWLMDADGGNPGAITATEIDEYTPRWSPGGEWIAYSAGTGNDSQGTFDLWLMRPDGSGRRVLNAAPNTEAWHVWRPARRCR